MSGNGRQKEAQSGNPRHVLVTVADARVLPLSHHVTPRLRAYPDTTIIEAMTPTQLRRWRTHVLKATQEIAAKQLGMSVKGYEKLEQGERRIAPWIVKLTRYITRFGVID